MKSSEQSKTDSCVLHVGIDVSKDTLAVYAEGLFEGDVPNTKKGIASLVRGIRRQIGRDRAVLFAFEETGSYSLPVHLELDRLHELACVLNPARVRHYAIARGVMAKTDRVDARIIRHYAAECGCEPTPIPSQTRLELRDMIRARNLLSKVRSMIMCLQTITRQSTCRTILGEVVRFVNTRITKLEREMVMKAKQDASIHRVAEELDRLPGIAPLTAATIATLVPELGTLGRRQAASIGGLAPVARESGRFKGLRKIGGGREELRRALYMPALTAIRRDPEIKRFYERLVDGRKKKKKVALTACMRKMLVHMDRVIGRLNASTGNPAL